MVEHAHEDRLWLARGKVVRERLPGLAGGVHDAASVVREAVCAHEDAVSPPAQFLVGLAISGVGEDRQADDADSAKSIWEEPVQPEGDHAAHRVANDVRRSQPLHCGREVFDDAVEAVVAPSVGMAVVAVAEEVRGEDINALASHIHSHAIPGGFAREEAVQQQEAGVDRAGNFGHLLMMGHGAAMGRATRPGSRPA